MNRHRFRFFLSLSLAWVGSSLSAPALAFDDPSSPDWTRSLRQASRPEVPSAPSGAPRVSGSQAGIATAPASPQPSPAVRLAEIAALRISTDDTYRIGRGDLIDVAVFGVPDLTRRVHVSMLGEIELPLVGRLVAAGRSESELASELGRVLGSRFVKNPQVSVFVAEYRSQQIAVSGAVARPGLYSLTRDRYTILDMVSEAGGLTKEAGAYLQFLPAPADAGLATNRLATATPAALDASVRDREAIPIDLPDLFLGRNQTAVTMRVVPGDVIFVPEAGNFTIEGWVDKPGSYALTRNTSVLAALSAGGGSLLPADLGEVEILRADDGRGVRAMQRVDLRAIRAGTAPDVALHAGDVVRVPASTALVVPWGFYTFVRSLVSIGASIPIL